MNKKWIYIAIGVVVLFIVIRWFKSRSWYLDFKSEPTANAKGRSCNCKDRYGKPFTIDWCERSCDQCCGFARQHNILS